MPGDRGTSRRSTKAKGAGGRTEIATQPSTRVCGRRRPIAADGRPMATHSQRDGRKQNTRTWQEWRGVACVERT